MDHKKSSHPSFCASVLFTLLISPRRWLCTVDTVCSACVSRLHCDDHLTNYAIWGLQKRQTTQQSGLFATPWPSSETAAPGQACPSLSTTRVKRGHRPPHLRLCVCGRAAPKKALIKIWDETYPYRALRENLEVWKVWKMMTSLPYNDP